MSDKIILENYTNYLQDRAQSNEWKISLLEIFQELKGDQDISEDDLIVKKGMYFYPIKVTAIYKQGTSEEVLSDPLYIYLHACKSNDNKYHLECNSTSVREYNDLMTDLINNTEAHENDEIMYFIPSYSGPIENQ